MTNVLFAAVCNVTARNADNYYAKITVLFCSLDPDDEACHNKEHKLKLMDHA